MLASGLLLVALLACLTIMVLMSVWQQRKRWGKLPPGPPALPFIGNYLQLNTAQMYNSLKKFKECYGPVFTVHLGPRVVVVLCGQEAVKEALVDQAEEFSGQGEQATFGWLFKGYGMVFSNGEHSKQHRRFSINTLRDFGVGKQGIEDRIQEEAGFLLEALQATRGALIDPTGGFFLSRTVSNVISSIVFGDRFDYEDKEFMSLLSMILGIFQFTATSTGQGTDVFPMLGSVLKDPKFFSNPLDFNPQHFLDEKGQFKKNDAFVPFSIGKRYCFGEGLARMELFLFLTTIMQNFYFKFQQSPQDIDVSPKHVGFATIPPNYTMSFLPR
ncbi:hypothetical protein HJG60_008987 [Phyllostomus discolor]|uniref:Cytochrome P450 2A13-like n=1 Tax=Phyllostomus discolor TaxID=89673 RepID=A0A833YQ43_9CHIR|nr:hypothetical protein HJG60_008987 [Phyllostomus discolor]